MIDHLPGRWRREADELARLAVHRADEGDDAAARRLLARAETWRLAASELEEESPPHDVHTAHNDRGGTAHADDDPDRDPPHDRPR